MPSIRAEQSFDPTGIGYTSPQGADAAALVALAGNSWLYLISAQNNDPAFQSARARFVTPRYSIPGFRWLSVEMAVSGAMAPQKGQSSLIVQAPTWEHGPSIIGAGAPEILEHFGAGGLAQNPPDSGGEIVESPTAALDDPAWNFRTIDGLAESLHTSPAQLWALLEKHPDLWRRVPATDPRGRPLVVSARRRAGLREWLIRFRASAAYAWSRRAW